MFKSNYKLVNICTTKYFEARLNAENQNAEMPKKIHRDQNAEDLNAESQSAESQNAERQNAENRNADKCVFTGNIFTINMPKIFYYNAIN